MIDVIKEVSVFKPIDLTRIPEIYKPATEQMRNAFILYNKALHEVHLGHEDVAKNYLRKAVTIFPDFYDAVMVLGILVFANGDRIGAVRIFNSVKNSEIRTVSIGILDHLVEEAERPATVRNSVKNKNHSSQDNKKLANVMSGVDRQDNRETVHREAKYSKGQVFERSSGYYEPQPQKNNNEVPRKKFIGYNRTQTQQDNSEIQQIQTQRKTVRQMQPEEAVAFKNQAKDIHDVRLLNKYLLVIVGVLIAFAILLSTLLINKTSDLRRLENKLKKENVAVFVDINDELEEEQNGKIKNI